MNHCHYLKPVERINQHYVMIVVRLVERKNGIVDAVWKQADPNLWDSPLSLMV